MLFLKNYIFLNSTFLFSYASFLHFYTSKKELYKKYKKNTFFCNLFALYFVL